MTNLRSSRKLLPLLILAAVVGCATSPPLELEPSAVVPERIIIDTDLGVDVDDAGAIAVAHVLQSRGEARILAVVSNVHDKYAPGALDAINTRYGRGAIPVGRAPNPNHYPVGSAYWKGESAPQALRAIFQSHPHPGVSTTSLKSSVEVMRAALAASPDRSVTIVGLGFFNNQAELLRKYPALVKRKVKRLVVMAGSYPNGGTHDLYLSGGRDIPISESKYVLANWPTPVFIHPGSVCGDFQNGLTLTRTLLSNPVRTAYRVYAWGKEPAQRPSWDLCVVLEAVRGSRAESFGSSSRETLTVTSTGNSHWIAGDNGRHRRVFRKGDRDALRTGLERMITLAP